MRSVLRLLVFAVAFLAAVPAAPGEEAPKDVVWKSKWKLLSMVTKTGTSTVTVKNYTVTSIWEFSRDGVITITETKTDGSRTPPTVKKGTYSFAADGKTATMKIPGSKEPLTGELKISSSSLMTLGDTSDKKSSQVTKWERTR